MYKTYPEHSHVFEDAESIHRYIHGGRGVVTLTSPSGTSHSYYFGKPANQSTFPDDVIFVYAAHNNEKLFYIGMMEGDDFRLTRNSRFLYDTDIVKGAIYIVRLSLNDKLVKATPMELRHEGMCARCGRPLTSNSSIEYGMGKACRCRNSK